MQRDNESGGKGFRVRTKFLSEKWRGEINMARPGEVVYRFSKADRAANPARQNASDHPVKGTSETSLMSWIDSPRPRSIRPNSEFLQSQSSYVR